MALPQKRSVEVLKERYTAGDLKDTDSAKLKEMQVTILNQNLKSWKYLNFGSSLIWMLLKLKSIAPNASIFEYDFPTIFKAYVKLPSQAF